MKELKDMNREELYAYLTCLEAEKEKRHQGRGRPAVPLLVDETQKERMMQEVQRVADLLFDVESEKFVIYKKEHTREKGEQIRQMQLGKALFWGIMYVVLIDAGYIYEDNNVSSYHTMLKESLKDAKMLAPREKIGDITREWYKHRMIENEAFAHRLNPTLKMRMAKYRIYFEELKNAFLQGVE